MTDEPATHPCDHDWEEGQFECNLGVADYRCRSCGAFKWKSSPKWGDYAIYVKFPEEEKKDG